MKLEELQAVHARSLSPSDLLAKVDEGAGEPYRTELMRRLEALRLLGPILHQLTVLTTPPKDPQP